VHGLQRRALQRQHGACLRRLRGRHLRCLHGLGLVRRLPCGDLPLGHRRDVGQRLHQLLDGHLLGGWQLVVHLVWHGDLRRGHRRRGLHRLRTGVNRTKNLRQLRCSCRTFLVFCFIFRLFLDMKRVAFSRTCCFQSRKYFTDDFVRACVSVPNSMTFNRYYCASTGLSIYTAHPCPAGTYSNVGASACTACSTGRYQPGTAKTSCVACGTGQYTNTTGAAACTFCAAGTASDAVEASDETTCAICLAGQYAPRGASSCEHCSTGQYSSANGAAACTDCDAGYYCPSTGMSDSGFACAVGTYSSPGESACTSCPVGQFADTTASGVDDGAYTYYTAYYGTTGCTLCNAGQYQDSSGQVGCIDCPVGRFASQTGISNCAQVRSDLQEINAPNQLCCVGRVLCASHHHDCQWFLSAVCHTSILFFPNPLLSRLRASLRSATSALTPMCLAALLARSALPATTSPAKPLSRARPAARPSTSRSPARPAAWPAARAPTAPLRECRPRPPARRARTPTRLARLRAPAAPRALTNRRPAKRRVSRAPRTPTRLRRA